MKGFGTVDCLDRQQIVVFGRKVARAIWLLFRED
ncbi:hypothetical protein BC643_2258 [Mangrovibacterium diazotrophicum]|uniref:Uncharacterized protein n=1 Tax=Mangrovibacterium diazotrophicum TaxID=1261403 RepID=A0A419W8W5_9BACT|nr:hypothetical protein BC643_2258 [Mangrovibacterium diazotrophicum]